MREPGDIVSELSGKVGSTPTLLQEIVTRLYHDEQVRLVWALYNVSGDALDGDEHFGSRTESSR